MAEQFIAYDPEAPAGQRLPPEVREEIAEVAPSTLNDGEVTTNKLDDGAVTHPKLAANAVHSENIAAKQVKAPNIDDGAVGTPQLDDGAVTAAKAGLGVVTVYDDEGNPISLTAVPMSDANYAALVTKDPNTLYLTLG